MKPYQDFDASWRYEGFEDLVFTTKSDAIDALELATRYAQQLLVSSSVQEARYRKAAQRAESGHGR